jgi:hypothetical protein
MKSRYENKVSEVKYQVFQDTATSKPNVKLLEVQQFRRF